MKRKIYFTTIMLIIVFSSSAFAGKSAGCGLGTLIWKGSSGMFPNVLAVTTNGQFSASSAITSGTSECSASDVVMKQYESEVFVADNFEDLEQNISRGSGEYLSTYAVLMGCSSGESEKTFAGVMKRHHQIVFADDDPKTIVEQTNSIISSTKNELRC